MFWKTDVINSLIKFTEKHLWRKTFSIKLQLTASNFTKKVSLKIALLIWWNFSEQFFCRIPLTYYFCITVPAIECPQLIKKKNIGLLCCICYKLKKNGVILVPLSMTFMTINTLIDHFYCWLYKCIFQQRNDRLLMRVCPKFSWILQKES